MINIHLFVGVPESSEDVRWSRVLGKAFQEISNGMKRLQDPLPLGEGKYRHSEHSVS